jgi:hypothetical protein
VNEPKHAALQVIKISVLKYGCDCREGNGVRPFEVLIAMEQEKKI